MTHPVTDSVTLEPMFPIPFPHGVSVVPGQNTRRRKKRGPVQTPLLGGGV